MLACLLFSNQNFEHVFQYNNKSVAYTPQRSFMQLVLFHLQKIQWGVHAYMHIHTYIHTDIQTYTCWLLLVTISFELGLSGGDNGVWQ